MSALVSAGTFTLLDRSQDQGKTKGTFECPLSSQIQNVQKIQINLTRIARSGGCAVSKSVSRAKE
jgi:hypothetical protein